MKHFKGISKEFDIFIFDNELYRVDSLDSICVTLRSDQVINGRHVYHTLTEEDYNLYVKNGRLTEATSGVYQDNVNHPKHYTSHPSGIECITVTEHMSFNIGNAVKYLWRQGLKADNIEDMKKAIWYINREIERVSNGR